eukprot:6572032-Pyramimonas_sp.AAC.1
MKLNITCGLQAAREVFKEMEEAGHRGDTATYNAMIGAAAHMGRWKTALQRYKHMRRQGVPPDATTFCSLISAYEKVRRYAPPIP